MHVVFQIFHIISLFRKSQNLYCNTMRVSKSTYKIISMSFILLEPPMQRIFDQVSDFTFFTKNHGHGMYVKITPSGSNQLPYNASEEYSSYIVLQPYLNLPKVKFIPNTNDLAILTSSCIDGVTVSNLLHTNPQVAVEALQQFYIDTFAMWDRTKKIMYEQALTINRRVDSIDTIAQTVQMLEGDNLLDKRLTINGQSYPSLREVVEQCLGNLSLPESFMVIGHGDENLKNVIVTRDDRKYVAIDPLKSGLVTMTHTLNTTIGTLLLFELGYDSKAKIWKDSLVINYNIDFESKNAYVAIRDLLALLLGQIQSPECGRVLLKEFLFANLIRGYAELVNPKNVDAVKKSKFALLGLAVEIFYDLHKICALK